MGQDGAALERLVEIEDQAELAAAALEIGRDTEGLALLVDRYAASPDTRLLRAVAYPIARAAWDDGYGRATLNDVVLRFIVCARGCPDPDVLAGAAVALQGLCETGDGVAVPASEPVRTALGTFLHHGLAHDDPNVRDECCGAVEALDADGSLARLLPLGPAIVIRGEVRRQRAAAASHPAAAAAR